LPAGGEQWIARAIREIALRSEPEAAEDATLEIMRRRFSMQLLFQNLMENLERARALNEC
jgi:hypothetical protein